MTAKSPSTFVCPTCDREMRDRRKGDRRKKQLPLKRCPRKQCHGRKHECEDARTGESERRQ